MVSVNIEFNEESLAAFIDVKMNNKLRSVDFQDSNACQILASWLREHTRYLGMDFKPQHIFLFAQ